jgi:TPR repeat protein
MYKFGQGAPENQKTAEKWFTLASEQGHANAQNNMRLMYDLGQGVPVSSKTAVKWYTLAAKQGYAHAQDNLGAVYEYRGGLFTDYRRAYMWYNLGSYNGSEKAGKHKDTLAKEMTTADISKAQDMSSLCLESNYTDC